MTMHWFPKATSEPPPAPPAITEGSSRGNMKREHFREMPKGPPPALHPQPTLTDAEREAVACLRNESYYKSDENCTNADMIRLTAVEREAVEFFVGFHTEGYGMIEAHAATLRKLLDRTK